MVVLAAGLTAAPAQAQQEIKVGLILPYTGTFAALGTAIENGFRLYVTEQGGKFAGREIEFVKVDDESDPAKATDNVNKLVKATGGGVAAAIDFVGAAPTFSFGFGALRKAGKLVCVGLFGGSTPIVPAMVSMKAVSVLGSYVGSLQEMQELMALARSGVLPGLPLITAPLAQATQALEDLRAGRIRGRTILKP